MDPNTAFYIISSGRTHSPRAARRIGPSFNTLEQAARALGFLRRRMPAQSSLHIEEDVAAPASDD